MRVDNCPGLGRFKIAEASDAITANRDVDLSTFAAAAVVNRATLDHDIKLGLARRGHYGRRNCNEEQSKVSEHPGIEGLRPHKVDSKERQRLGDSLGSTGRWPVVFGGSPKTSRKVHVQS
jgi:hypothetical protein